MARFNAPAWMLTGIFRHVSGIHNDFFRGLVSLGHGIDKKVIISGLMALGSLNRHPVCLETSGLERSPAGTSVAHIGASLEYFIAWFSYSLIAGLKMKSLKHLRIHVHDAQFPVQDEDSIAYGMEDGLLEINGFLQLLGLQPDFTLQKEVPLFDFFPGLIEFTISLLKFPDQLLILEEQSAFLERFVESSRDLDLAEGLGNIIECPQFHAAYRRIHGCISRDHHRADIRIALLHAPEHLNAIDLRHHQVD